MSICKDCIHYCICDEYVSPNESFPEVEGGCKCFKASADAVEVKHGYWFFTEYEYFTCSECSESYYNGSDCTAETRKRLEEGEYYPYCPHCAAKVDAEPPKRKERKNRDV